MSKEEKLFTEIGNSIKGSEESQMFGKPCFKVKGKAYSCLFENEMVFKLNGDSHKEALGLKGAKLFDPSGKGRAMKEWVQLPSVHSKKWNVYAESAFNYVKKGK